jgi:azurin
LSALTKDDNAEEVVIAALKHPSSGVRKAAIQVLSKSNVSESVIVNSNILKDPDPNTRLAAILALTDISPSATIGALLHTISLEESVNSDHWLGKAVYAAATQHKKGFMEAFLKANPGYAQVEEEIKHREALNWNDADWKSMSLPQTFEKAGLNIDGVVWFRLAVNIPGNMAGKKGTLSLGPIDDSDVTYVNGVKVGSIEKRRNEKRIYDIPGGTLKTGNNVVAVRVEDNAGNGGLYGQPDELFLEIGGKKLVLKGDWKYEVEKEYNPRDIFGDKSLAEVFVNTHLNPVANTETNTTPNNGSVTSIKISVIKNEMKYDLKTFSVEAGKPVEITFENPDFMQHNLVITQMGALKIVGEAADKLASHPNGAEMNYVPAMPEVLFATKLVNPQQTVKLNFIAPSKPGDYPFVCTFPGHWSIMNGVMRVVGKKTAL